MIGILGNIACECRFPFDETVNRATRFDMTADVSDVIALLGDSNSGGVQDAGDLDSITKSNALNSYRYNYTGAGMVPHSWEALTPGTNTGATPSNTSGKCGLECFLASYYWMQFQKPLYFVKVGLGGVTASPLQAGSFHPDASGSNFISFYSPMNEGMGTSVGLPGAIGTFRRMLIIHHGANDASTEGYSLNYQSNINDIVIGSEALLTGQPYDRIVDISMSDLFTLPYQGNINTAKTNFIASLGSRAALIDPGSAQSIDGTHWTGAGQEALARKVFLELFYI